MSASFSVANVLDILIRSLPPYRCILSGSVFCGALEATFVRDRETPINPRSSNFRINYIGAIVCGDQRLQRIVLPLLKVNVGQIDETDCFIIADVHTYLPGY